MISKKTQQHINQSQTYPVDYYERLARIERAKYLHSLFRRQLFLIKRGMENRRKKTSLLELRVRGQLVFAF